MLFVLSLTGHRPQSRHLVPLVYKWMTLKENIPYFLNIYRLQKPSAGQSPKVYPLCHYLNSPPLFCFSNISPLATVFYTLLSKQNKKQKNPKNLSWQNIIVHWIHPPLVILLTPNLETLPCALPSHRNHRSALISNIRLSHIKSTFFFLVKKLDFDSFM